MIVEFLGAPGAGKSTLTGEVLDELRRRGVRATSVAGHNRDGEDLDRRWRPTRLLVRTARLVATPRLTLSSLSRLDGRAAGLELMRLQRREAFRRQLDEPDGVLLLDEGPLHKVTMMVTTGRVRRALALADVVSEPDLCVALDVDVETARDRIRSRPPTCNLDFADDATIERYVARYLVAYEQVMARMSCRILRVDACSKEAVSRIVSDIAEEGVPPCTSRT